ncbi:MAG: argininosuccinate lyase [Candidatus Bipolaricaulia bacterium]
MKLWETEEVERERIVETFVSGDNIELDRKLIKYDALGSIAHARMLQEIGILSEKEFKQLRNALVSIIEDEDFTIALTEEDVHTAIENRLTDSVGDVGKKIHTARSRNDQVLVDMRLYTRDHLLGIALDLLDLCDVLVGFSRKHRDVMMPGYTHMRQAMPSSVGLWTASFVEALLDDLTFLQAAYDLNDQNPLGAAAGYGTPLQLDRKLTAELLGFRRIQNNPLYAVSSRGKIEAMVLSALAQVMLDLSRLSNDLILFSTEEFQFFLLPDEFCTGSSIMPQKKNPDLLELTRARSSVVLSDLFRILEVINGLPSGHNADTQETKRPVFEGMEVTQACVCVLTPLVDRLEVNEQGIAKRTSKEIFAADRALELVQHEGLSFRDAYRRVKQEGGSSVEGYPHRVPKELRLDELREQIDAERERWEEERTRLEAVIERLMDIDPT